MHFMTGMREVTYTFSSRQIDSTSQDMFKIPSRQSHTMTLEKSASPWKKIGEGERQLTNVLCLACLGTMLGALISSLVARISFDLHFHFKVKDSMVKLL